MEPRREDPPMPTDKFERTLEAARQGSEGAWTDLYRQFAPRVLGYLRRQGEREAEDLLAEVMLQAARDLDSFEGGERRFAAWIMRIARNRVIDHSRARARRPADPVSTEALDVRPDPGDVAEQALARAEFARIRDLFDTLPSAQREVLLLRSLGDLTIEEIGEVIGKSPGAVKALQRRGLAALSRVLLDK